MRVHRSGDEGACNGDQERCGQRETGGDYLAHDYLRCGRSVTWNARLVPRLNAGRKTVLRKEFQRFSPDTQATYLSRFEDIEPTPEGHSVHSMR